MTRNNAQLKEIDMLSSIDRADSIRLELCSPKNDAKTLGVVAETTISVKNGRIYAQMAFGRIVDELAKRFGRVLLCAPTSSELLNHHDYELKSENIELVSQPAYSSSIGALRHPAAIAAAYNETLKRSDCVFIRGMLPYSGVFYSFARFYKRKPVHWIVGDPVSLLKSHRRSSKLKDAMSLAYAHQDRFFTKIGRRMTGGSFLCNGNELADVYASNRTRSVISSTINEDEFYIKQDNFDKENVKILFIGFVRPEKGVEYLIEALPKLKINKSWQLTIVGPWEQYQDYKSKLDNLIQDYQLEDRITWEGHVSYGLALWEYLRSHDIFVLPTLSEGTPRVLVEARANSLPIVATNVGGIPTSVTDGVDGILVTPKDSSALADAISSVVEDDNLRTRLIESGLKSVSKMTINYFIETVMGEL